MNSPEVIISSDIQNAYIKFYSSMMQYLWDIETVMNLAKLEIAIYKRFPDKEEMEKYIEAIERDIRDTINDSENPDSKEFKKRFEVLRDYIESFENPGLEIWSMNPIKEVESSEEIEEITEEKPEKKKIKIGKIEVKSVEDNE